MKKISQSKFVLTIIVAICVTMFAISMIIVQSDDIVADADTSISFSLYAGENLVNAKDGVYYVLDSGELSLVFDREVSSVSVRSDDTAYSIASDNKTVVLGEIDKETTLTVEADDSFLETVVISVGWVESSLMSGVYYIPNQDGWRLDESGEKTAVTSPSTDRLSYGSMKLVTRGVEFLSLNAVCYKTADEFRQTCGIVSTDKTTYGVNDVDQSFAFVLDARLDVINIEYMPQSTGDETLAELRITDISDEKQYYVLTANFDDAVGDIYYFDSFDNRVNLVSGSNNVLKGLTTDFYFVPKDRDSAKLYGFSFNGTTTENQTFNDGIGEYVLQLTISEDSSIDADFKQTLNIPAQSALVVVKQNGVSSNKSIGNGGTLYLDYTYRNEITLSAPALSQGEKCDLYVDGVKLRNLTATQGEYVYTYGLLTQDKTFTFVYSKDGNYADAEFEYSIVLVSENSIEQDLLLTDNVTVTNDEDYPYAYSSLTPSDRVGYVAGNRGVNDSISVISFTVNESGTFAFDYYTDISEYSYCFVSVGAPIAFGIGTDFDQLVLTNGIGEEYGDYTLNQANHGNHGWRKKMIDVTVTGESLTIYIYYVKLSSYDGYVDETKDLFSLSGVAHYVGDAVYYGINRFDDKGSFVAKINGADAVSGASVSVGSTVELTATPVSDAMFYGWIINSRLVSTEPEYSFVLVEDVQVTAVMQQKGYYVCKDESDFYTTVAEALSASTNERKIVLIDNCSIDTDVTIAENVELLIPFAVDDETGYRLGTADSTSNRVSWADENKYLYLTLTVNNGVTVSLNGKLTVGAVRHCPNQSAQGRTSGAYSQIINDGVIRLSGNAYVDVNGLIKGSGRIIAESGTTLREPFIVNNYAGGTITLNSYTENSFPFYNYALINIQCDYEILHGAKLIGSASLFFSGSITTQDITVVASIEERVNGGDGSLYWLHSGSSMIFSYSQKSVDVVMSLAYLADSGVTTVTFNGTVTMGEFALSPFGSFDMVLGLPYTFGFVIEDGATLIVPQKREYMILPGCQMLVKIGGTLQIDGGLYVLDGLKLQALAGKRYPSASELENNDFAVSGMLINNGTVNVVGSFAGIIQSTATDSVVDVGENAVLIKTINIGTESNNVSNRVKLTLTARAMGLTVDVLTELSAGNQYRSYDLSDGSSFVLDKFVMDSADGFDDMTVLLGQQMQGFYGLVTADGLSVIRRLYIGEKTQGVVFTVNDQAVMTDENGLVTLSLIVGGDIRYKSTFENEYRVIADWKSLANLLLKLLKNVELSDDNVYEIIYDENGEIVSNAILDATVLFYDGDNERVALTISDTIDGAFVKNVGLVANGYSFVLVHEIKTYLPELATFVKELNSLSGSTSEDLVTNCTRVYADYQELTTGLDGNSLTYVNAKIDEKVSFAQEYKDVAVRFVVMQSTYGDETAKAIAYTVDGGTKEIDVVCRRDYVYASGVISATFDCSLTATLGTATIDYSLTQSYSGINQKEITVVVDDKTSVYGDETVELTATVSGLVDGDDRDQIFMLVKGNGSDVGEYVVTAQKVSENTASFYTLKVVEGRYVITKRPVTLVVNEPLDMRLSSVKTGEKAFFSVTQNDSDISNDNIEYTVTDDDGDVIFKVDGQGVIEVLATITVGEFTLTAINNDNNYSATIVSSRLSVIEDDNYYAVDVKFDDADLSEKIYDGASVSVFVEAVIGETGETVDRNSIKYTIIKNGVEVDEIKVFGDYVVKVVIDNSAVYTFNYSVKQKTLTFTCENTSFVYNGEKQIPTLTLDGIVGDDDVEIVLGEFDSINAGEKVGIIDSLKGNDATNYTLSEKTFKYAVDRLTLNVTVENASSIYGDIDSEIVFVIRETIPVRDALNSVMSIGREIGSGVGDYEITVTCINDNYTVVYNTAYYTVLPKPVKVVVDDKTAIYGDPEQTLTARIETSIDEKDIDGLYSLRREEGNARGTYKIFGQGLNKNYKLEFTSAVYIVNPRSIEIIVPDVVSVYGDPETKLTSVLAENSSLYFDDVIDDVVNLVREAGDKAGKYKITLGETFNDNYVITKVSYTNPEYSIYSVERRKITVKLNDKVAEDGESYQGITKLINDDAYVITQGNLVEGDVLSVIIKVIYQGSDVVMNEENFADYYVTGNHVITLECSHDCYDVTVIDGELKVTKAKVKVVDMVTEYVYDDGNEIEVFDPTVNIRGNLKMATETSFGVEITDVSGNVVQAVVGAGVYKVKVIIRHDFAFEFTDDAVTEYVITVTKKDVSESLSAVGISPTGTSVYDPYPNSVFGECSIYGVEFDSVLYRDGVIIDGEAIEVGSYKLVLTITDANYVGTKTFEWQIVKKDISSDTTFGGIVDGGTYVVGKIPEFDVAIASKYKNVKAVVEIKDANNNAVDSITSSGVYSITASVDDDRYVASKTVKIEIIDNYDQVFDEIRNVLDNNRNASAKQKFTAVSTIRKALQKIKTADREKIEKIDEYNSVLTEAKEFVSSTVREIESVAQTAKRTTGVQTMSLLSALSIIAYFGIKKYL